MTGSGNRKLGWEFAGVFVLFGAILTAFFHGALAPGHTLFSNDGPLGRIISECHRFPDRFTGCWSDLNGIGFSGGAAPPGISVGLQYLLQPIWFSKLYALISLNILGWGAWCFFAQMRLSRMACIVGALAAVLNSCFFSVACWGVAAHAITVGLCFFAMAALARTSGRLGWIRVMLGGFGVGLGVVDGADVGALFSLLVALFLCYQWWISGGAPAQRFLNGSLRLLIVVLCAGLIAAQAISSLVETSIQGTTSEKVAYSDQDNEVVHTKEGRWDWATQWSLPIREAIGLVAPGLFGYRLDTPGGGAYWGDIGQDPSVTRFLQSDRQSPAPSGLVRSSGGGFYAGVFVVIVGLWAFAQSLRGKNSIFNHAERRWLWFWMAVVVGALLLAFGRFAPFYQLVYALPYFSSIRNPIKFIYLVSLALIVLFTYGLEGLHRKYMTASGVTVGWPGWSGVWRKIGKSEKKWLGGGAIMVVITLLCWFEYASNRAGLIDYLHSVQFGDSAETIASFSIRQVGWLALYLALSLGVLGAIFGGAFSGQRARWAGLVIGGLLLADLGRANLPWIVCWDYHYKYASNPIIETLRDKPYEQRVTCLPGDGPSDLPDLNALYHHEWLPQQFPFYNIQTLDIVDMPRKPADFVAYVCGPKAAANGSTSQSYLQMWRLTNTRYVLGMAEDLASWNGVIGQTNQFLRVVERFNLAPRTGMTKAASWGDWTAVPDASGSLALFEYTGALPRAKLYENWQVQTNDDATLAQLFAPEFDPWQNVLVSSTPAAGVAPHPGQPGGIVNIVHYSPRNVILKSDAPSATVLLLNDHYDPHWKVFVDGRPQTLLRCNFIMQGVSLEPGAHVVEFRHQPPYKLLYVSLATIVLGLVGLTLVLCVRSEEATLPEPATVSRRPAKR